VDAAATTRGGGQGPGDALKKLLRHLRYGTLLYVLQERLSRLGILIAPYFLVLEEKPELSPGLAGRPPEGLHFCPLNRRDLQEIARSEEFSETEKELLPRLEEGDRCYGLKRGDAVIAYNWAGLKRCAYRLYAFELNAREAYLFGMATAKSLRGRGLAPLLRFKTYEALEQEGRTVFYSISDAFNRPAVRFKKKLGARFLELNLYIEFFGKVHWKRTLKKHPGKRS